MPDWVFKFENVGKRYRVPQGNRGRYATLRETAANRMRCLLRPRAATPDAQFVWALRNAFLQVRPGEVVGIIGRNGSGKSTLLKLLSRITVPTTGRIRLRGRVSSLLEVGTGFHAELTGRENIYLNGSILGMRKRELDAKVESILSFAEVEDFAETPVKRFSSGMHVRLAFAVAAHLEPEILVIDEVLAVGDAAFQSRCFAKMQSFAEKGRAVVFVSHDLNAVERLCSRAILLEAGAIRIDGPVREVLACYKNSLCQGRTAERELMASVGGAIRLS